MIKSVNSSGKYMMVNGGMPVIAYTNTSPGFMNVGDLRFNSSMQRIEVYDGISWIELNTGHAMVGLTPEAERALAWAIAKQNEEMSLEEKAKTNTAIADLLDQRKTIDAQLNMVEILSR